MKKKKKLNLNHVSGGMSLTMENDITAKKITLIDNSKDEHTKKADISHKETDITRDVRIF